MFNLKDIRAVREHYSLLEKKFKRETRVEINASGIEIDEPSEFDRAIEEAIALFDSQEEEREKEKTTMEHDRNKAEDVRLVALETARESMKRSAEAGPSGSCSFRAKRNATIEYLKEKAEKELEYKLEMEMAHKEKELELRRLELEVKNKEVEAQKAQNQNILGMLLALVKD